MFVKEHSSSTANGKRLGDGTGDAHRTEAGNPSRRKVPISWPRGDAVLFTKLVAMAMI